VAQIELVAVHNTVQPSLMRLDRPKLSRSATLFLANHKL
jgi:hypothetical protein